MLKPRAIFFDFDGVLCTDRFYTTLKPNYPHVWQYIGENIFGGPHKYADRWMRGEFNYYEINKLIADATGISFDILNELFIDSVRKMKVNPDLIRYALSFKQQGIRIALVTCNMDIFNEITVPEKKLADIFTVIINSFDYKIMKQDGNGKLFDIALHKLGLDSYNGVWLIDDSPTYCYEFTAKGGYAYLYSGQKEFELWLNQTNLF
jgi:FMN phosphatase YigB (HAD superfamily)